MSYVLGGILWSDDLTIMCKKVTALKNIKREKREAGTPCFSTLYDIDTRKEDFGTVEKALKALEIIKEFGVLENNTLIVKIPLHKITENGVESDEENLKKLKLLKEVLL